MITKLENPIKSKYFAIVGDNQIELPITYTTIQDAASWLDKRTEAEKEARVYERFPYTVNGVRHLRVDDVTRACIEVLWNYYEVN